MKPRKLIVFLGLMAIHLLCHAQRVQTQIPKFDHSIDPVCGGLANAHGPFDYRMVTQEEKDLVENVHFNPQEMMLTTSQGRTDSLIWGEFDYTLRAFPNNPRALAAVDRLSQILQSEKPVRARYSANCYFLRAIKFTPDDANVRLLYGFYLIRRNKVAEALVQLAEAEKWSPDDRNVFYNMGLAYFKAKEYEKSREYAEKAYALGFPLPGLRNMLERAGKW